MSARLFAVQCKLGAVDEQLGNFEQVSLSAYYHVCAVLETALSKLCVRVNSASYRE